MEAILRISISLGIFLLMVSWEYFSPRRSLSLTRQQRWPVNLGLALLNMAVIRFTVGGIAYLSAIDAMNNQWGLLNLVVLPQWLTIIITLLVLDVVIYFQHRIAHRWKWLWRLHQVHHTDLDFDASTAVRFHPLEIIFSLLVKVACVYALGANPFAVIVFEILLNGSATFNHSNIKLPLKLDKILRWIIVTPDMHRIHHSCRLEERDSNYGFSVAIWDRLFNTYTANPKQSQEQFPIGLDQYREVEQVGFFKSLLLPFKALK